ncbi:hypothetical protein N665_0622s0033 [Sinapis alba]|nr:hypothetical protein N665_0622s0033 [Sinapis alba]
MEETTTDVKQQMTPPSVPANYVSILQLRERWIIEKERKLKEQEEEERRRKHHAEEEEEKHIIEEEDPKKPRDDLDDMRLNSKKEESIDGGEARRAEEEETAAIGSERGEDDGLREKKRGRRKRYHRKKKRTNQEAGVVEECGSIKPPEYTVKENNNTPVSDQIRVYRKKEEKAMGNKSVEKPVTAIGTQFEHLSIKRGQETKHLKAQTRHDLPLGRVRMPIETATMVWVKKGKNERAGDGYGSGVKPLDA